MKKKSLLNKLVDKYESSKSFVGKNRQNQSFSIRPEKIFPKYLDDEEVDFFAEVNDSIKDLESNEFISVDWTKGCIAKKISLNVNHLNDVYKYIDRQPRKQTQEWLLSVFDKYQNNACELLQNYFKVQRCRIEENQNVEFFNSNEKDFEDSIRAVDYIQKNTTEILIRNASLALFKDSKRLENIASTIEALMRKYGDYDGCDDILAECNVVRTPTQVLVKGNANICLDTQIIDLSKIEGDIGFSTKSIDDITFVEVLGCRVVTIENLTSFYTYENNNDFVIYLGGFHNAVKREFIKKIYNSNPSKTYMHFGDIDAGGFYILKHLRTKTGVNFLPMKMDIETLQLYKDCVKTLSTEDRKRLEKLLGDNEFKDVIAYMLENDCKLEQENVTCLTQC
ncbi:Wadjet anti-phage system protein JetD domain-containing protein [Fibrobacter succinogenes]|uniref:Wadjet protein JetD C-terminal domain-containing protein n=1 Tax=Fibrobacter succinogenes TaxID=833 RepID=A0A380S580_FIBSU|nr:Wadjet anti-phage system protein JetD domain-containing protein [Fibrobacter succinogenes]PWJ35714.1 uncharacterized protein DUF2220 [Fibrobacter succinogenes subsp. elongatus]SUQ24369.1 hypothetical protein SAMN05661053_1769 [Fibrobacter succinogenes]